MRTYIFVILTSVISLSSCAGMRAQRARHAYLKESLSDRTLAATPEELLAQTRMVLVEQGFVPHDVSPGMIETDWKQQSTSGSAGASSAGWKYVATALATPQGTRLVIMRNGQNYHSGSAGASSHSTSDRDFNLELQILKRIDAAAGSQIEAEAEARAQAAAAQ